MTPVHAIIAKELKSSFVSPIVYVVASVFLLIFGVLSYMAVVTAGQIAIQQMQFSEAAAQLNLNDLVFRPTFYTTVILLILILPMLTMRVFSEERKLRTFELLATSPISITEIVAGKFLGVYCIYLGLLVLTGCVPLVLSLFSEFNWDPIFTSYLGLALVGGLFIATGLFASALTENQIIAAFISFGLLLGFWLLGGLGAILGDTTIGNFVAYLSFLEHFDRLFRGLLDMKDLVYYLSGIFLMLFLTHRVIESQRWK